jgi:hypothetical protein
MLGFKPVFMKKMIFELASNSKFTFTRQTYSLTKAITIILTQVEIYIIETLTVL